MILSQRLSLFAQSPEHLADLRSYYLENAAHLEPWEPARAEDFNTESAWQDRIQTAMDDREAGRALKLVIRRQDNGRLIGVCNYSNIVRGPFQACHLGYSLSESEQGCGYMFEALNASMQHVFAVLNLHRIMANYVPENHRSGRLLERLGFIKEGIAKQYLHINGEWRDHILTSKINPAFSQVAHP